MRRVGGQIEEKRATTRYARRTVGVLERLRLRSIQLVRIIIQLRLRAKKYPAMEVKLASACYLRGTNGKPTCTDALDDTRVIDRHSNSPRRSRVTSTAAGRVPVENEYKRVIDSLSVTARRFLGEEYPSAILLREQRYITLL